MMFEILTESTENKQAKETKEAIIITSLDIDILILR